MRQLLLRVPDDVHTRLAERARESGRSVNAVATDILDRGVADTAGDERARVRARARRLGILAEPRPTRGVPADERSLAIASTRGLGPVLDRLLDDGR